MTRAPVGMSLRTIAVALSAAILLAGCSTGAGHRPPPSVAPEVDAAAHLGEWAHLIYAAKDLYRGVLADHDRQVSPTFRVAATPARVARDLRFTPTGITLREYTGTAHSFRYCLTTRDDTFYAAEVTDPGGPREEQTTTMGVGECDYATGVVHATPTDVVVGDAVLTEIRGRYERYVSRVQGSGAVVVAHDGRNRALARAAVRTARAVLHDAARAHTLPMVVTAEWAAEHGVAYPAGVQIGYYANRGDQYGFRLCLTDGTEEAIYLASPTIMRLVRHSRGRCYAAAH